MISAAPWPDEPPEDPYEAAEPPPGRRSWRPVDLTEVLDGTYTAPEPTVGARDDGVGMFYLGRMHTIAGESEGGKTWLALAQAAVELRRGNAVTYLDFEDDEGGVVGRLLTLGADRDDVRHRFAYLRPEQPIAALGNYQDLGQALEDLRPTLVVIDGVTEAMTLHGLNPLDNKDAATFGRLVPRWIADRGPAVVALDHVTKSAEGRGRYALGAVHKLNGLNGAAYLAENRTPFGIGVTGRSTVLLAKDRPGQLRRHGVRTSGDAVWFADLALVGHDETWAEASVTAPVERPDDFRPTVLMARVSEALAGASDPLTSNDVVTRVRGKATEVRRALAFLVDDGYVCTETGARGARLHRLAKPFAEQKT